MWSGKGNWRDSRVIYKGRGLRFSVIKKFNTRNFILDSKKLGERMKKFSFHHSMPSPPPRASSMLSAYFPFCKCKSSEISSRISFLKVTLPSFFCFFFCFLSLFSSFPPSHHRGREMYSSLRWMAITMCFPLHHHHRQQKTSVSPSSSHVIDADRLSISIPTSLPLHQFSPSPNFSLLLFGRENMRM